MTESAAPMHPSNHPGIELKGLEYFAGTAGAQARREQAAEQQEQARKAAPPPKPMLPSPQHLARQSPQPDRLVAVKAAVSPLFEAARPLLDLIARIPADMDEAQANALHGRYLTEVASFQSICGDASMRYEFILAASYALCTALDEAMSDALHSKSDGDAAEAIPWLNRSLAMHFHQDSQGGEKVFKILGRFWIKESDVVDVLELYFCMLRLGFTGVYRVTGQSMRRLDDIQRRLYARIDTRRRQGEPAEAEHWQQLERQCFEWTRAAAALRDTGWVS